MNTTTFFVELPGHTRPAPVTQKIPLWPPPIVLFARRMYARARRAGYFRPVRVVIRLRLPNHERNAEPYENPEFV